MQLQRDRARPRNTQRVGQFHLRFTGQVFVGWDLADPNPVHRGAELLLLRELHETLSGGWFALRESAAKSDVFRVSARLRSRGAESLLRRVADLIEAVGLCQR